jgi:hypothetical protein
MGLELSWGYFSLLCSWRFDLAFFLRGVPGLAPAGASLFFASPKKSKQKKGEPNALSLRFASGTLRCSVQAGSG